MEIQYLKKLEQYNTRDGFANRGLSLTQITHLESLYNNSNPFPNVLKELLFLAGKYCAFISYGGADDQEDMQNDARQSLLEVDGVTISRPHYFIDFVNEDSPVFMFLDEGDNPELCQIAQNISPANYYRRIGGTLQDLIGSRIQNHLDGYGAF